MERADINFDLDNLAERFGTQSGGGLSPELATDLALEIVLNEIVEQACLVTGASGAAVVLKRDGALVCRASSGSHAPELGAQLDTGSGLSAECMRTLSTQRCDDGWSDPRVDGDACRTLGVRSVLIVPLVRNAELVGMLELFSSEPNAFGEEKVQALEPVATRVLESLDRAAARVRPQIEKPAPAEDFAAPLNIAEEPHAKRASRWFDFFSVTVTIALIICAVLIGILIGERVEAGRHAVKPRTLATTEPSRNSQALPEKAADSSTAHIAPKPVPPASVTSSGQSSSPQAVTPGSLAIFQNGKEVFHAPTSQQPNSGRKRGTVVVPAASLEPDKVFELSPSAAQTNVIHRVEPVYPEEALSGRVQGTVVLQVHIAEDGTIQDVQPVSGTPILTQASIEAVKQWRFRARKINGVPVEMQTTITLNFRLPRK